VDFLIRDATESDFEALLALFDEVAAERIYIGTQPGFDRELYRSGWSDALVDPDRLLLVAIVGDAPVGTLGIRERRDLGAGIGMLVSSDYRKVGIGSALLDAAFAWARGRGFEELTLSVFPHNLAALALYRSAGFVEVERIERAVTRQSGEVWGIIRMRKHL